MPTIMEIMEHREEVEAYDDYLTYTSWIGHLIMVVLCDMGLGKIVKLPEPYPGTWLAIVSRWARKDSTTWMHPIYGLTPMPLGPPVIHLCDFVRFDMKLRQSMSLSGWVDLPYDLQQFREHEGEHMWPCRFQDWHAMLDAQHTRHRQRAEYAEVEGLLWSCISRIPSFDTFSHERYLEYLEKPGEFDVVTLDGADNSKPRSFEMVAFDTRFHSGRMSLAELVWTRNKNTNLMNVLERSAQCRFGLQ